MRGSAAIIVNPVSGRSKTLKKAEKARLSLEQAGIRVCFLSTQYQGHGRMLAQEHAPQVDVLISVGGDGTLNEVINGLLDSGARTPVAVIPAGTANVIARELHIPMDLESQIRIAMQGPLRLWDIGMADARPFIMAVGIGSDAEIVSQVAQNRRNKGITKFSYLIPFYHAVFHYAYPRMRIIVDGIMVEEDATFTLVGNCSLYGGHFRPFRNADPMDHVLDVCAMHIRKPSDWLPYARYGLWRSLATCPDMAHYQGREIQILSLDPIPVQVDGDPAGRLPLNIKILPEAVAFCVEE